MKRLKGLKIFLVLTIICSIFSINTTVFAASAAVELRGNSTATVGENITITMYVSNVSGANGGIVSVGGSLKYDPSYLQYISGTGATSPYQFQSNKIADGNYKIAGLDTSLSNGITQTTKVFTFVFKPLKEGSTTITLEGASLTDTSQKVTTSVSPKTITISAAAPKSSDATLKSLSVSGYSISPSFSSSTTSYKVTVPSTESSVTINAAANHSAAKVSGTGKINLSGDTTNATIKVTAEDGTTKNYTVTINREKAVTPTPTPDNKSSDATLKSLDVSGYTLSPTFRSDVTTYSMKVENGITGLNVNAVANDSKASVSVSGNKGWNVGNNTITIKVVAENGTVNNYLVNVTRAAAQAQTQNPTTTTPAKKSTDNYLKSLTILSAHEITPNFDKNVTSYNIVVPNDVTNLDFEAIKNSSKATVSITGDSTLSTTNVNVIQITVTAEDNSIRIYTLNVTRSAYKNGAYLKELNINGAELSPKFEPDILEYKTNVSGKVNELDITATPSDSSSKVEIIGNNDLKEGNNSIFIRVTDKNGFTQIYSLDVVKEEAVSTILGFTHMQFLGILFIILLFLILLAIIFYLLRRKNEKELAESKNSTPITPNTPAPNVFEFKPEFNFNSKNSSDDDTILGNPSQNNFDTKLEHKNKDLLTYDNEPKKRTDIYEAKYEEKYDPYDEIVTKDELYDALKEAQETKNVDKLNMLLEQEKLNRKKEEIRQQEEQKKQEERMRDWR